MSYRVGYANECPAQRMPGGASRHIFEAGGVEPAMVRHATYTGETAQSSRRRTRKRGNGVHHVPRVTMLEQEAQQIADGLMDDTMQTAETMLNNYSTVRRLEQRRQQEKTAASKARAKAVESKREEIAAELALERARFASTVVTTSRDNFSARGWEVGHDMVNREKEARDAVLAAARQADAARNKVATAGRSALACANNLAAATRMLKRARQSHAETKRRTLALRQRASCAEKHLLYAAKTVEVGRCWARSAISVGRGGGLANLLVATDLVGRIDDFDSGDEMAPRAKRARR